MSGIRHQTAADATFSPSGATAWGEDHTIDDGTIGPEKLSVTLAAVATSGDYNDLLNTPAGGSFADAETPSGAVDGTNDTFTLSNAPSPPASLQLFLNGLLQRSDTDYTLVGATITYAVGAKPQTGDNHYAFYRY